MNGNEVGVACPAGRPGLRRWRIVAALLLYGLLPPTVQAIELTLPLTVPYALLQGLSWQPTAPGQVVVLSDSPCRRLHIEASRLEPRAGELHLVSSVNAALGVSLLGRCIEPIKWRGTVDAVLEPYVDPAWQLRFRLGETELRDPEGDRAPLLNFVWDLSQRFINRRVESYGFDLSAPREQVTALLGAFVEPDVLASLQDMLAALRPGGTRVATDGIRVEAQWSLPDDAVALLFPPAPGGAIAGPLEGAARTAALEQLDAFVVQVVRRLATELGNNALRIQLVELLLESRYRLVAILDGVEVSATDPVRVLFVSDWERLRGILLAAAQQDTTGSQLLRYAAFLNAGDILLTLDTALPQAGLWFSAAGLRQALRALSPDVVDPSLDYDFAVDPTLRELFGLPPDLPPLPPGDGPQAPDEQSWPPPDPDIEGEDEAAVGGAGPWPLLTQLLERLVPSAAAATAGPDRVAELQRKLGRRIPRRRELANYGVLVAELLREIAHAELAGRTLTAEHAVVFEHLLPATALIESCWRQFKKEDGKVTYLTSSAGAVGMLQINLRVWRGLYDAERLRWEIAYNARAGAQILMQYLEGPALDVVKRTGEPGHLARAAYAAYNAGPRGAGRFLRKDGSLQAGPVDRRLWSIYEGFARGGQADLGDCAVTPVEDSATL